MNLSANIILHAVITYVYSLSSSFEKDRPPSTLPAPSHSPTLHQPLHPPNLSSMSTQELFSPQISNYNNCYPPPTDKLKFISISIHHFSLSVQYSSASIPLQHMHPRINQSNLSIHSIHSRQHTSPPNDPPAGSPTGTLLRLLLPLKNAVQSRSQPLKQPLPSLRRALYR